MVRVTVEPNGSGVLFTVEDDGPGVPSRERETIFEPGRRGSAANPTPSANGAGLGLALSRRLARAVDGDVEARDAEAGARFVIRLPAA
jgi:signal transduction histidine kinase